MSASSYDAALARLLVQVNPEWGWQNSVPCPEWALPAQCPRTSVSLA